MIAFAHTYIKNKILKIAKLLEVQGFIGWFRIVRKKLVKDWSGARPS